MYSNFHFSILILSLSFRDGLVPLRTTVTVSPGAVGNFSNKPERSPAFLPLRYSVTALSPFFAAVCPTFAKNLF